MIIIIGKDQVYFQKKEIKKYFRYSIDFSNNNIPLDISNLENLNIQDGNNSDEKSNVYY